MGEKFYPDRFLKQVMPKSFYTQGLVSKDFTLQKGAISAINRARFATGRPIDKTVYDVLLQYKAKYKDLIAAEDFGKAQAFEAAVGGENLLRQRIEQAVIFDKIQDLKAQHKGEFYRWMPSSAENPDPQHGLLYGKIFRVGEGDKEGNMPGERYGCQCGIEFLNEAEDLILLNTSAKVIERTRQMFNMAVAGQRLEDRSTDFIFGKISGKRWHRIKRQTGLDLKGYSEQLRVEGIRHAYLHHGSAEIESARKQKAVTAEDIAIIPHITKYFDNVVLEKKRAGDRLLFVKKINKKTYKYVTGISRKQKMLINKTFFIKQ